MEKERWRKIWDAHQTCAVFLHSGVVMSGGKGVRVVVEGTSVSTVGPRRETEIILLSTPLVSLYH